MIRKDRLLCEIPKNQSLMINHQAEHCRIYCVMPHAEPVLNLIQDDMSRDFLETYQLYKK